jgi:hypothetical protein
MKPKKINARVMWEAIEHEGRTCHETQEEAEFCAAETAIISPVFVLPAHRADYEAMVNQVSEAMCGEVKHGLFSWTMKHMRPEVVQGFARAALVSVGIEEPRA